MSLNIKGDVESYAAYHAAIHASYVDYFATLVESLIDEKEEKRALAETRRPQVLGEDYELARLRHWNVVNAHNAALRRAAAAIRNMQPLDPV
jgi:hypothetical protein